MGQEIEFISSDDSSTTMTFLIDTTNQYNLESVKKSQEFRPLSTGIKVKPDITVWVQISNINEQEIRYISVGNFDYIEMYEGIGHKKLLNGRLTPLRDRCINGFPILFPLDAAKLQKPIFFKIQHENPLAQETVQVKFLSEKERNSSLRPELKRHNNELIFIGGMIGLFMIFLFFSLLAFIFTGKHYYNFYSIYIITNLIILLVSAERFSNLDIFFSQYPNFLIESEPLLFAILGVSYNIFLKKFIAATHKIKWIDLLLNCFIAYEILIFIATPYLRDIFDNDYVLYKLHEVGLIPLIAVTIYFLYDLFKSGQKTLKLISGVLFLFLWGGPVLYFLSSLGENQTLFLNPNMPFHFLMVAELIFFTLILGNEEYRAQIALENEKADLKYRLSDVEKAALQAQMHPHFISNCLTSIQSFVLQNDKKKAIRYLSKFSKLVRHNLNASVDGVLTIKEEVDFLDIYLTLEKQRFNQAFDYKITLPENSEIEKMTIAPLLIQPYVENAVLHGISTKSEGGMINVDFLIENENLLIKIKDNGIGFNAAKSRPQKETNHKSVGMTITHDRLALLDYGEKVEVRDLAEKNSKEQGTEVSIYIKIPKHE